MDYIKDTRSAVVHIPTREQAAIYTLGRSNGRPTRGCICGATIKSEFVEYVDDEELDVFKMCTTCDHLYRSFRERWGWDN